MHREISSSPLSKFTQNNLRSTVFDASYEQAYIATRRSRKEYSPLNLNRKPIALRSSLTFYSTVFAPVENFAKKERMSQENDWKQKKNEEFKPNYKAVSTWKIDLYGRPLTPLRQERINEIRPVASRVRSSSSVFSPSSSQKILEKKSKNQIFHKNSTRCSTPQNPKFPNSQKSFNWNDSLRTLSNSNSEEKIFFDQKEQKSRLGRSVFHKFSEENQIFAMQTWNKTAKQSLNPSNSLLSSSKSRLTLEIN